MPQPTPYRVDVTYFLLPGGAFLSCRFYDSECPTE